MNEVSIEAMDAQIRDNRPSVEMADALDRLSMNRDFKTLILKGYCQQEAVRLVQMRADPSCESPEKQAAIIRELDAISYLQSYFRTVQHLGAMARSSIKDAEDTRESILKEDADV